jgi:CRP/FNR family transcriptional regulator, cyclic AMP receptor protein
VSVKRDTEAWPLAQHHKRTWPRATFLATLPTEALHALVTGGELVRFADEATLIRLGEQADDVFLLLDGIVKVTAPLTGHLPTFLAARQGGDIIGEIAYADQGRRTATVIACGTVIAVRVDHGDLRRILSQHEGAEALLTSAIVRKFRGATQRRVDASGFPPSVRLARALLELAEDYGSTSDWGTFIGFKLSQAELGGLVGVSPKTTQRALDELRDSGLVVSPGRRQILIPDLGRLRQVAWPSPPEEVR